MLDRSRKGKKIDRRKALGVHLIYLDESGNTGINLKDAQQPVFVLAALIVAESCWQHLEQDLLASLASALPGVVLDGIEVHASYLRGGRGHFADVGLEARISLRHTWLEIAKKHQVKLVYRAILKTRFERWLHATFGVGGVIINPHVAAFPLVAKVVDQYLAALPSKALGMFISDENKEIVHDIEKSIRVLRGDAGSLRLGQIVEKGFFIDSRKSRVLQLCDLCALTVRKMEEEKIGITMTGFDKSGVEIIAHVIHRGNEPLIDVVAWLTAQHKKK